MFDRRRLRFSLALLATLATCRAGWALDLQFTIASPGTFSANQLTILNDALARVERMWETALIGYQPGIAIASVPVTVQPSFSGLASASYSGSTLQGGFTLATSGFININVNEIENFANWQGVTTGPCLKPPTNLNYIDELLAHETGHVLGIGTLWASNGVYNFGSHQYSGAHGLAAYQAEFDAAATFVPVEDAGNAGTPDAHWDQLMRSSPQEGDPNAPWCLDPRVGVLDPFGRDRAYELMTGAIDPDHGQPFLSRFTVESMRDMGYLVAQFEDFNGDGAVNFADRDVLLANLGATGLETDSLAYGDADRDRDVDDADLTLWRTAAGVPEPSSSASTVVLLSTLACRRRVGWL